MTAPPPMLRLAVTSRREEIVRVTIIGRRVFAVEIASQALEVARID